MKSAWRGAATITLALLTPPAGGQSPAADFAPLVVHADRVVGRLKPLRGVNGAPDMRFANDGSWRHPPRPGDLSGAYRQARINLVRTHDSASAGDIDPSQGPLPPLEGPGMGDRGNSAYVLFPDLSADPDDPKSYNFGPTDRLIAGIRGIGADVIFRLGRGGGTTAEPPRDLARYAEIIRHIVLHYEKGWAGGPHASVRYWEIWNEPDLGRIWWRGTPEQYYALYAAAARAIRSADPSALVGGPTIALVNQTQPYREDFLAYVRDHRLPLDFFSWHYYSDADDPYDFVRIGRDMRRLLDHYGFTNTLSVLDEWNAGLGSGLVRGDAGRAAFVASSLIYMQDAPIDREGYYRADGDFGADGAHPDKVGQALIAFGRLADTADRLSVVGGDDNGLAVVAGRSRDGRTVQLLISNYEVPERNRGPRQGPDVFKAPGLFEMALPPRRSLTYAGNKGYRLVVDGLTRGARYEVQRYRVSGQDAPIPIDRTIVKGPTARLSASLPAPAIERIVIRRLSPGAGKDHS
jgi:hypothetical protein